MPPSDLHCKLNQRIPMLQKALGLRLIQSSSFVNTLSNSRSSKPIDNSSSNSSFDTSISNGSSNPIDVAVANVLEKTITPLSDKGKGKAVDDGSSGKGKNIDVSKVSESAVKNVFRKNTSCKTGCLARMMVRKIDGDMFEVYGFVEKLSNSNVRPVRAFKLMKDMYGGFENIGATVVDCKNFRRDMNMFIGDRNAQMVVEKLDNLEKHSDGFFVDYYQGGGDLLCGLFWADKVARLNYKRFGDEISFDATFRSNK
ncbi:FAR1 DNA binding domain, zinc finger, SWIM-type, MULE transposase domain containing protein [Tanacetum coccineum]